MEKIKNKVISIIRKSTNSDIDITPDTLLLVETGIDSLDYIEIILNIEKEFNIHFSEEEIKKFENADTKIKELINLSYEKSIEK